MAGLHSGQGSAPPLTAALLRLRLALLGADRPGLVLQWLAASLTAGLGWLFLFSLLDGRASLWGWPREDLLRLWALAELVASLSLGIGRGLSLLGPLVLAHDGFDRLLLRPGGALPHLLAEHLGADELPAFVLALVVLASQGGAPMGAVFVVGSGVALLFGGQLLLASLTLAGDHRGGGVGALHQAAMLARYPLSIFPKPLRRLLLTLLPLGWLVALPTAALRGLVREDGLDALGAAGILAIQAAMGLLALGIGGAAWRWAIGRRLTA